MKHILTFEQAVNEGVIDWVKDKLGLSSIYRVNFAVEYKDDKDEPIDYNSNITVKAKNEDDAEDKFYEKWNSAVKSLDDKPKVIVKSVKKTDKMDKKNIELPRSVRK